MQILSSFVRFIDSNRRGLILGLVGINISFGFLYAFLINNTIHHAVAVDKAQTVLTQESTRIAELESRYMQLTSGITLDYAYNQGFVDASTRQTYISARSLTPSLSFNVF